MRPVYRVTCRLALPAKMIIKFLLLYLVGFAWCGQELVITHVSPYISIQQQEQPLQTSHIPAVIARTLGISTPTSDVSWNGFMQSSLFQRPKANVLLIVHQSVDSPQIHLDNKAKFPVVTDAGSVDVGYLMNTIQSAFFNRDPLLLDAALDNSIFDIRSQFDVFGTVPSTLRRMSERLLDADSVLHRQSTGSLNSSHPAHLGLMGELQMIADVINMVSSNSKLKKTDTPDVLTFTVKGLKNIIDRHGSRSEEAGDASTLLADFIQQMTEDLRKLYKDNVVVEVLTLNPSEGYVRKVRSLKAVDPASKENAKTLNLSKDYDKNYPVFFNIIFWFMVLLSIAVYAICYGIWFMDPGRDSIIYRMTSQRLKKE